MLVENGAHREKIVTKNRSRLFLWDGLKWKESLFLWDGGIIIVRLSTIFSIETNITLMYLHYINRNEVNTAYHIMVCFLHTGKTKKMHIVIKNSQNLCSTIQKLYFSRSNAYGSYFIYHSTIE